MNFAKTLHAQTKPYAKDHPLRSWWFIISTTVLLLAATVATLPVVPVAGKIPLAIRLLASVLAGLFSLRLFVIYHDQQHHAILANSKAAEFFMAVFGIWALSPRSIWRSSHDHHHAHNSRLRGSNIGSYPIMTRDQFQKSDGRTRFNYLFARHPLTILFGYFTVFLVGMVLNPFLTAPRKHFDCLIALLAHLAIAALLVVSYGWQTMILALVLPRFIATALGSYLFYAQHNFPGVSFKDKAGWTFEKAALESSSHLKTGPIMGYFTANIGYHHIHHLNHRIPFYRLPEIYHRFPELQKAKTTSLHPLEVFRCLRLKVWCVDSQRMVGTKGL